MALQPDLPPSIAIEVIDEQFIQINQQRYTQSVMIAIDEVKALTLTSIDACDLDDWAYLLDKKPEVIIVGTGAQQHFISPSLQSDITRQGIGIECMNTRSACHTYSMLATDGRKVAAILIFPL